jgi:hypothetical protein
LPDRAQLSQHPWLKPWAPRLLDPQLWRFQHEAVARGVAVAGYLFVKAAWRIRVALLRRNR